MPTSRSSPERLQQMREEIGAQREREAQQRRERERQQREANVTQQMKTQRQFEATNRPSAAEQEEQRREREKFLKQFPDGW